MNSKFSETEPCYRDKIASDITRLYLLGDSESVEQAIDLLLKQKPIDIANLTLLVQRYIENEAADGYEETAGQEWGRCLEYHYFKYWRNEYLENLLAQGIETLQMKK